MFARRDKAAGHLQKREFGPWIFKAFSILARLKRLRGTVLDVFGYTAERKMERALPGEYSVMIFRHRESVGSIDFRQLIELAKSAELVRGFGHIKEANVERFRQRCERIEHQLANSVVAEAAE